MTVAEIGHRLRDEPGARRQRIDRRQHIGRDAGTGEEGAMGVELHPRSAHCRRAGGFSATDGEQRFVHIRRASMIVLPCQTRVMAGRCIAT